MKTRIKASFNKAWKTYDDYCGVQKSICEKAIELLLIQGDRYPVVADFACGTGLSTQCLVRDINVEKIIAIDFCENLLEIARAKNSDTKAEFLLADFDDRLFPDQYLDLIFCNMGLQWSIALKKTLALFHAYLQNSGVLVFSMPLDNTFPELHSRYKNSFHTVNKVISFLDECQYHVELFREEVLVDHFSTALDALRSIKSVGANCGLDKTGPVTHKITKNNISELFVNPKMVSLTYHVGIFVAKKSGVKK